MVDPKNFIRRQELCNPPTTLIAMRDIQQRKIKLFLDADDTILESSRAFIDIVNKRYAINPPKQLENLRDWGYRSLFPSMTNEEIIKIYDSVEFFDTVKINSDFENFYFEHEYDFEWNIVTKGHESNIKHKEKYFKNRLPQATVIGCRFDSIEKQNFDKSHIDMNYGIQIDDRTDCLMGSNANIKILIKNNRNFYWNKANITSEPLYIMNNWKEITETLEFALENSDVFMERS